MPLGKGQEEWEKESWAEVLRHRDDYHTRRTNFGEGHPKTKEATRDWDNIRARHYGSLPPERRANELANFINTKEQRREAKNNKLGEMQANLAGIEAELADVEARRAEAVQAMQSVQDEIRGLEREIEKARSDRAEVLRLVSEEAQTESWRRSQPEPQLGPGAMHNIQAQFYQLALLLRGSMPGVDHMLREAEAAGVSFPNFGEQSCPRDRAGPGQWPSRKRSLEGHRPLRRGEEDMQTDGESLQSGDESEFEPMEQEPGARRQHRPPPLSSHHAQEEARRMAEQYAADGACHTPNLMGHVAWGGNPPILAPPQPGGEEFAPRAMAAAPPASAVRFRGAGTGHTALHAEPPRAGRTRKLAGAVEEAAPT